ncbi:MYB-transcription factor 100 [Zea mays]|uniref:MYB-transcription factor 100 n=1 Tax=Zea mays TaxID=4577 RepID=A0A1D6KDC1_MAIZE|nr:MYB-transcription factor 100 [Zea mays]
MVEDSAAPAGKDGQRDQELLEDPGAEARQAAQLRRQQQALQGRHALPLDAAPRRRRRYHRCGQRRRRRPPPPRCWCRRWPVSGHGAQWLGARLLREHYR